MQKLLNFLTKFLKPTCLLILVSMLNGCGYNALQSTDEQVTASWAEVLNQYQHRANLTPSLINTVKGYAAQEKEVLLEITEAHDKTGSMQATPELIEDPDAFILFQSVQSELTDALTRLLAVAESYPELRSSTHFRDLQAQLEETEKRITTARNRYIKAVQEYNVTVRSFPSSLAAMILGYQLKLSFIAENENTTTSPSKIDFDTPIIQ